MGQDPHLLVVHRLEVPNELRELLAHFQADRFKPSGDHHPDARDPAADSLFVGLCRELVNEVYGYVRANDKVSAPSVYNTSCEDVFAIWTILGQLLAASGLRLYFPETYDHSMVLRRVEGGREAGPDIAEVHSPGLIRGDEVLYQPAVTALAREAQTNGVG